MFKKSLLIFSLAALLSLAAATAAGAAVSAGNTGWNWGNPLPQGNTLTTIDTVGGRVYAGGATGTLLKSNDGGTTWSTVRTGLLDDIRLVRAIGPDSFIFAASCALRRSDDAGASVKRLTWGPNDESCSVGIRSFYFPTGAIGYLLLENGDVMATADSGDSWTKKTTAPTSKAANGDQPVGDIWFTSANTGVVTVGNKIYQTTDGATSWTPVGDGGNTLRGIEFINPNDGFAVGNGYTVLQTTNGGANWAPVTVNVPVPTGGTNPSLMNSIECANPNTCIVATASGKELVRTVDGGANWASVSPSSNGIFAAGFTSGTNVVAVGGSGATVLSSDKGETWSTVGGGPNSSFTTLRALSNSTAVAFGGNTLARTTNGGASWSTVGVSTSQTIVDAAFPSATRGYVLDSSGTVLRSNNGGTSWQFLDTGSSATPRALVATNDQTILLAGPKGIRRSANSGDDFAGASGKNLKKITVSAFDRAGSAVFAYGSSSVIVSNTTGKSWKSFKKPPKAKSIRKLDMVSAKAGYVLDGKSELWVTRNAGKKWTRIETTGANFAFSMAFGDLKHGYLTDLTGRILYTADAGKTWSRQYPFFDGDQNSATLVEAPSATTAFLLVRETNRLFSTTTGGLGGTGSTLTIKSSSKKVRRNTVVKITGKLSPIAGGERVAVLARAVGASNGTRWATQERTVSANGTFTTTWRVKKPTVFIARWSGDAAHDGDAAPSVTVKIR